MILTVVVPTYNRAMILKECLEALAIQTLHYSKFEVIVGDDGSSDNTVEILKNMVLPYRFRWFSHKNSGPNAVRNKAVKLAEAPVIVFFNDDTIATPGLLEYHKHFHAIFPDETFAFLGRVTIDPSVDYSPFAKLHLDSSFDQLHRLSGGRKLAILDWRAFFTCNLSVKKSFLERYGLFDEDIRYGDDIELGSRLHEGGLKIIYSPQALGYHKHFLTESDYLNIASKEGAGLATWFSKKPKGRDHLRLLSFPLLVPFGQRLKYLIGDILFGGFVVFLWLKVARFLLFKNEYMALRIYEKIYQALKRKSIYQVLKAVQRGG